MPGPAVRDYDQLYRQFRWDIPARYNIGVDCCDKWAEQDAGRLAILHVHADGREDKITFGWLRETSNRLANVLRAQDVGSTRPAPAKRSMSTAARGSESLAISAAMERCLVKMMYGRNCSSVGLLGFSARYE